MVFNVCFCLGASAMSGTSRNSHPAVIEKLNFLLARELNIFDYQNCILRRLPIDSISGLAIGTYKKNGFGCQW